MAEAPGLTGPAAVLWDMDGTLIDSEPAWIASQITLVAEHGGTWTHEDGLTLVGTDMVVTAEAMRGAGVDLPQRQIIDRLTEEVTASLGEQVSWRPGAHELVAALAAADIPQAIVTTSPRAMAQVVADALPPGAIRLIVGGEDVARGKPDPEPYRTAAERLGVPIEGCVAVEDSPPGLAAAVASGAVAFGVPHDAELNHPGPWRRLDSLASITVADLIAAVAERTS